MCKKCMNKQGQEPGENSEEDDTGGIEEDSDDDNVGGTTLEAPSTSA
jgi:hypothetical protein